MRSGNQPITIRPYRTDDLPVVIKIFTRAVREICCRDYRPDQLEAWAPENPAPGRWQHRLENLQCLVAEMEDGLAGFIATRADGYFDFLFVHPVCQGKGVARALQRVAESALHAKGIRLLTVQASLTAKGFFEKHGFSVVREQSVEVNGVPLTNFFMQKILRDRLTDQQSLA